MDPTLGPEGSYDESEQHRLVPVRALSPPDRPRQQQQQQHHSHSYAHSHSRSYSHSHPSHHSHHSHAHAQAHAHFSPPSRGPLRAQTSLHPAPALLSPSYESPVVLSASVPASGGGGGGDKWPGGKNLNFLQKLYEFLLLEPHPCPDVIYWATDSRQLVIAKPDDLARDVLPRLFKHDKIASFGRQLNIYGFARVYPGRQFKDASGNLLDASVWAHPTLHRLSSPDEVAAVKRRAAPKLFRTRRLANGQIVRTRAGPEVERKFKEVKEDIANERRAKFGWVGASASAGMSTSGVVPGHGRIWAVEESSRSLADDPATIIAQHDMWYDEGGDGTERRMGLVDRGNEGILEGYEPSDNGAHGHDTLHGEAPATPLQAVCSAFPSSFDMGRLQAYKHKHPLSSIYEGVPLSPDSFHPTPTELAFEIPPSSSSYSSSAAQALQAFPASFGAQLDCALGSVLSIDPAMGGTPTAATTMTPVMDLGASSSRFYRSCPASIHSSPVPHPRTLDGQGEVPLLESPGQAGHKKVTPNLLGLRIDTGVDVATSLCSAGRFAYGQGQGQGFDPSLYPPQQQQQQRITAPAAPNPFHTPSTLPYSVRRETNCQISPVEPADLLPVSAMTDASFASSLLAPSPLVPLPALPNVHVHASANALGPVIRETSVYPEERSWERTGIIDPRWVSPRGSAYNTPAQTPRLGSPVLSWNSNLPSSGGGGGGLGVTQGTVFPVSQDRSMPPPPLLP